MLLVRLGLINFFVPCNIYKKFFLIKVHRYFEAVFNRHSFAIFEKRELKEVRILYFFDLHNNRKVLIPKVQNEDFVYSYLLFFFKETEADMCYFAKSNFLKRLVHKNNDGLIFRAVFKSQFLFCRSSQNIFFGVRMNDNSSPYFCKQTIAETLLAYRSCKLFLIGQNLKRAQVT